MHGMLGMSGWMNSTVFVFIVYAPKTVKSYVIHLKFAGILSVTLQLL